jgi:predicted GIY-YIG superfamily endonuclease
MPVDKCKKTFAQLAKRVLPAYMVRMRQAMKHPHPLSDFCTSGIGYRTNLRDLGLVDDCSGCYVLLREGTPFYVGISRGVIKRLRQHTSAQRMHATLAHRMAKDKIRHQEPTPENPDAALQATFNEAQTLLRESTVAFIQIENPLELYLFEAYCAMKLDTSEWNTFRTH